MIGGSRQHLRYVDCRDTPNPIFEESFWQLGSVLIEMSNPLLDCLGSNRSDLFLRDQLFVPLKFLFDPIMGDLRTWLMLNTIIRLL